MSTTNSNKDKFSIKFSKNAASANRNPKTEQNKEDTKNTRTVQSANDDVLTRYSSTKV